MFGHCGQSFYHDRSGNIFDIRARGRRGIEIQSSFWSRTSRRERAQSTTRRRAHTLRGECEFCVALPLFRASRETRRKRVCFGTEILRLTEQGQNPHRGKGGGAGGWLCYLFLSVYESSGTRFMLILLLHLMR